MPQQSSLKFKFPAHIISLSVKTTGCKLSQDKVVIYNYILHVCPSHCLPVSIRVPYQCDVVDSWLKTGGLAKHQTFGVCRWLPLARPLSRLMIKMSWLSWKGKTWNTKGRDDISPYQIRSIWKRKKKTMNLNLCDILNLLKISTESVSKKKKQECAKQTCKSKAIKETKFRNYILASARMAACNASSSVCHISLRRICAGTSYSDAKLTRSCLLTQSTWLRKNWSNCRHKRSYPRKLFGPLWTSSRYVRVYAFICMHVCAYSTASVLPFLFTRLNRKVIAVR